MKTHSLGSSLQTRSLTLIMAFLNQFCPHVARFDPAFIAPYPTPHILSRGETFTSGQPKEVKFHDDLSCDILSPLPAPSLQSPTISPSDSILPLDDKTCAGSLLPLFFPVLFPHLLIEPLDFLPRAFYFFGFFTTIIFSAILMSQKRIPL